MSRNFVMPSPEEDWDKLQDEGVGGLVGRILQQSAQEDFKIMSDLYEIAQKRIAELEKDNRWLLKELQARDNYRPSYSARDFLEYDLGW